MLQADFGWVIFAVFLLWIVQVLRAGARRSGTSAPRRETGPLEGTQREGEQLEELLRQLGGRLGQGGNDKTQSPRRKVLTKGGAPAPSPQTSERASSLTTAPRSSAARSSAAPAPIGSRALAAAAGPGSTRAVAIAIPESMLGASVPPRTITQLRQAVLWVEVLGPPKGLQ